MTVVGDEVSQLPVTLELHCTAEVVEGGLRPNTGVIGVEDVGQKSIFL